MLPHDLPMLLFADEPAQGAPMRFTPAGCCPCGPKQCGQATNDVATIEFDVVLAGYTNDGLCACSGMNQTYRVRWAAGCTWVHYISPRQCWQPSSVLLVVGFRGDDLTLDVQLDSSGAGQVNYRSILQAGSIAPIDLTTVINWNVPFFNSNATPGSFCSGTGTTCTVTAIQL